MKNIGKTKPLDLTGQGLAVKINFKSDDRSDKNNYSSIYHNCQESFQINQTHYHELISSGIDPDVIALNFKSLEGDITHEYLLSDAIAKLGDGKQTPHSSQYTTSEVARYFRMYNHTLAGGWWCAGVDPLNNYAPMEWGCFKADNPRQNPKQAGKIIKYEHPYKCSNRAFFLRVPKRIWQMISDRYGVPIGDCEEFWEWVLINNLPIIFCEGAKKAAALLSCGFIAVGLPGINGAYRKIENSSKKHILIPDIELFATVTREFIFCFDNDVKPTTRKNVRIAIAQTSRLLKAKKCQVKICDWTQEKGIPEKGIDDVLVVHGKEVVENIITTASPVSQWQTQPYYQLSRKINLNLNQRYLGDILSNIPHKIIGVKSPKGTGKTEALKPLIDKLVAEDYSVYLVSHRVQLCEELCKRLGVPYIDNVINGKADRSKGFGIVVDSLHGQGKGQFDVENDTYLLTNKYVVILDEVEQVLWHLLNSSTEVKEHRTEVIKQLQLLLLNADKIVCLDADLTDVSLDFIQDASKCKDDDIFIINNEYKEGGYKILNYEETTPVNLLRDLLKAVDNGDKLLICTDSQKIKGRFSTQNIESIIIKKFPHLKDLILRIDSETIADPEHPAYGCITKINDIIKQYLIVIISPSVGTGISIDVKNYFTGVWGCFQGVQSENAVRQQLMRLRDNVPRHLWIAPTGLSWQGDGSTSLYSILNSNRRQFKIHLQQLKNVGFEVGEDYINTNDSALNCYAKMACRINNEMGDYRGIILENLLNEGNTIINKCDDDDEVIKEEITSIRDEKYLDHLDETAAINIDDLDSKGYERLSNQKHKTKADRQRHRKYSVKQRYQVDVTPDLILKDDDGYYPQLRLHYFLTLGFENVPQKDQAPAKKMRENQSVFLPDFNKSQTSAKVNLMRSLNIPQILELDKFTQTHPLLTDMVDKLKGNMWDVGMFLGKLHPDMTPIQILRKILKPLGLKLDKAGREGTGDRNWIYRICGLTDGRSEIFQKWYESDLAKSQDVKCILMIQNENENCIKAIPNPSQNSNINNISNQDAAINQDANHQTTQPDHIPQNCFVWDDQGQAWVGAVLKKSEILINGTYKALVTLWNGLDRCIWSQSRISIC
ncbi:plasmid replication protein, CyRepA1 family [Anabaena sp. PCC 7108]|uniref:plasmid replication protein, CyRepA1 family n=1 Tax=Anabaena sp. PCC 7108 TaxID=163908 RepID=UPI00036E34F0|nr:plasmid replication protein, CyRepA1 family [Anabaena sp. PCC 7108]